MEHTVLSPNWKKLQVTLKQNSNASLTPQSKLKRKRIEPNTSNFSSTRTVSAFQKKQRTKESVLNQNASKLATKSERQPDRVDGPPAQKLKVMTSNDQINAGLSPEVEIGRYVALDCEMVGVGPDPDKESALARVSIVNYDGNQIYDSYVKPLEKVTDWRTHISGITPKQMLQARSLEQVQDDVSKILQDRTVIGHSIRNDLDALLLGHPKKDIRDTARHPPYRKLAGGGSPKLKLLASEILGLEIQIGEHSSIDDARACMLLFRRDKAVFDREHAKTWPTQHLKAPHVNGENNSENLIRSKRKRRKRKKK